MGKMDITSILIKDKTIQRAETVQFIIQCLGLVGVFPGVVEGLSRGGLKQPAVASAKALKVAIQSNVEVLELESVDRETIKAICGSVIETLEDYQDLHPVLGINVEQAEELRSSI